MSIEGLLLSLLITGIVAVWVGSPIIRRTIDTALPANTPLVRQRERLTIYYGRVLRNIHDLDEDFSTGKLPEDEYNHDRALWTQRGMLALKAFDELEAAHLVVEETADDASIDSAIDDVIESAIRDYKRQA